MYKNTIRLIVFIFMAINIQACGNDVETKTAIASLQEIQSATKVGISYYDLVAKLQRTNIAIDQYLRKHPGESDTRKAMAMAMGNYISAVKVWEALEKWEGNEFMFAAACVQLQKDEFILNCVQLQKEFNSHKGDAFIPRYNAYKNYAIQELFVNAGSWIDKL